MTLVASEITLMGRLCGTGCVFKARLAIIKLYERRVLIIADTLSSVRGREPVRRARDINQRVGGILHNPANGFVLFCALIIGAVFCAFRYPDGRVRYDI